MVNANANGRIVWKKQEDNFWSCYLYSDIKFKTVWYKIQKLKNGVAIGLLQKDQEIYIGEKMDLPKKINNI